MSRKYELKQRAARQAQTRQRIVTATVALHETLGPAHTTISAIAERAGVQRLTVYRHFPDDESVFRACTDHWYGEHQPPDPAGWTAETDPSARLRLALTELYAYFRCGEPMLTSAARDLPHVPALAKIVAEIETPYWEQVCRVLVAGWAAEVERHHVISAAIGLATGFSTWQSLAREHGLDDEEAVDLMVCLVSGAAGAPRSGLPISGNA